jgi:hypothetical protein
MFGNDLTELCSQGVEQLVLIFKGITSLYDQLGQ